MKYTWLNQTCAVILSGSSLDHKIELVENEFKLHAYLYRKVEKFWFIPDLFCRRLGLSIPSREIKTNFPISLVWVLAPDGWNFSFNEKFSLKLQAVQACFLTQKTWYIHKTPLTFSLVFLKFIWIFDYWWRFSNHVAFLELCSRFWVFKWEHHPFEFIPFGSNRTEVPTIAGISPFVAFAA